MRPNTLPLLCFLTGIGCASAPPPISHRIEDAPPPTIQVDSPAPPPELSPGDPAEQTAPAPTEPRRPDPVAYDRQMRAAHNTSRPGNWNPARGERPADRVAPPPARHCRTVAATETQGRVYTVRQADGSYSVGVEPVPGEVVPLEICP